VVDLGICCWLVLPPLPASVRVYCTDEDGVEAVGRGKDRAEDPDETEQTPGP
jgi:hypothetical protein